MKQKFENPTLRNSYFNYNPGRKNCTLFFNALIDSLKFQAVELI